VKLRVYLDTSVFSACEDDKLPDRRQQTMSFWADRTRFDLSTSVLAEQEIMQTPDPQRRQRLRSLLEGLTLYPVTDEVLDLARRYVDADVFATRDVNDAVHVAAAVLNRQDILLSWNFRHLVNRLRRAKVNQLNVALGLPGIEILAPPEL